jgi:hypothetical protein
MEILDNEFRSVAPEDEKKIGALHYEASMAAKGIRQARIALYVLMGLAVVSMVVGYFQHDLWDVLLEGCFWLAAFSAAAWFAPARPRIALIAGLSIYILQVIAYGLLEPTTLARGLILKAAVIYYLAKGISAALQIEKINAELRIYGQEASIYD